MYCYYSRAADEHAHTLCLEDARRGYIEERAAQIESEMWNDLEYVSDALSDAASSIGGYRDRPHPLYPNHPEAKRLITLFRDGTDDLEAMRMLRIAMRQYIEQQALEEAGKELEEHA